MMCPRARKRIENFEESADADSGGSIGMTSKRSVHVLLIPSLTLAVFLPHSASAELKDGDRASFTKNFIRSCETSGGTDKLVSALAGTAEQKQAYCHCVANAYADRLDIRTINKVREIQRGSLADWSRRLSLTRVFPDKGPFAPNLKDRRHYPLDADTVKRVCSWTTNDDALFRGRRLLPIPTGQQVPREA